MDQRGWDQPSPLPPPSPSTPPPAWPPAGAGGTLPPAPVAGSGAATTALTCGIVGLAVLFVFFPLAVASIVLGIVAVKKAATARREAATAGTPVPANAKGGRILGILSIVFGSLTTAAMAAIVALLVVGATRGWFDTGYEPQVVVCQPTDGGTRVEVELRTDANERLTYDYTVEVADESGDVSQATRTVTVAGRRVERLLVPLPDGSHCHVTSWYAYG